MVGWCGRWRPPPRVEPARPPPRPTFPAGPVTDLPSMARRRASGSAIALACSPLLQWRGRYKGDSTRARREWQLIRPPSPLPPPRLRFLLPRNGSLLGALFYARALLRRAGWPDAGAATAAGGGARARRRIPPGHRVVVAAGGAACARRGGPASWRPQGAAAVPALRMDDDVSDCQQRLHLGHRRRPPLLHPHGRRAQRQHHQTDRGEQRPLRRSRAPLRLPALPVLDSGHPARHVRQQVLAP